MKKTNMRTFKEQAEGLEDLCKQLKHNMCDGVMVEIGAYQGEGTSILAETFDEIWSVDPWRTGYDDSDPASVHNGLQIMQTYLQNTDRFEHVHCVRAPSLTAARMFADGTLDFVYIDGLHTYEGVVRDIHAWMPKIKEGGWIGGHDYKPNFKGVTRAVNEHFKDVEVFQDSSWLSRPY